MLAPLTAPRGPLKAFIRRFHLQQVTSGSRRVGPNFFQSPELKMFLKLVKSPSHLMFVASNIAMLVHLLFYSSIRQRQKAEEYLLQMSELELYVEVIEDLDRQNEHVQKQIAYMKMLRQRESSPDHQKSNEDEVVSDTITTHNLRRKYDFVKGQVDSAHRFVKQRESYQNAFNDPANVQKLFPTEIKCTSNDSDADPLTYSSPIQNSVMAICGQLVKSLVVELNLRRLFGNNAFNSAYPLDSFLLVDNLFTNMENDEDKLELMAKVKTDVQLTSSPLDEDSKTIDALVDGFGVKDSFSSKKLRRTDLYHYKSGRWLNYEHSDTFKFIRALPSPTYTSSYTDTDEYVSRFKSIFSAYENGRHPLGRLSLLLEIAKVLVKGGESLPTLSVFQYLIDKLGKLKLYNYQSLIYYSLPSFGYRQTVLADSLLNDGLAPRRVEQLRGLIEEEPEFLKSFLEYQIPRNDVEGFKSLLRVFEADRPDLPHLPDILPPQMWAFLTKPSDLFKSGKPVMVGLDTIESALSGCVQLNQVDSIDKILNKLLFSLIYTADGIMVSLGKVLPEMTPVLKDQELPAEAMQKLLSPSILLTLATTYVNFKDLMRGNWLLPHLKAYLGNHEHRELEGISYQLAQMASVTRAESVGRRVIKMKSHAEPSPIARTVRGYGLKGTSHASIPLHT